MAFSDFIVKNGLFVENDEDAISSTIGGSFTTLGGMAIGKKLFVGTDVDIGGKLHIAAGTDTAAPITLTSGTNLTTPTSGSIEYDGTRLYFTPSSNDRKIIAYQDDVHYIGTSSVSLNRTSANLSLTGISSVAFPGSTSGDIILQATTIAGTNTITLPAITGTVVTTGDTGTITSTMIANNTIVNEDINSSASISVNKLSASTISGVTLGNNLYALSLGTGLEYTVGTTYDGSADATISLNQAAINTIIANTTFIVNDINIGTTNMSVTRASGNQSFTGFSSIGFPGSTSGNITLQPTAIAGTHTITLPATTGTVVTTGDTGTVTSTMIANDSIINDDINSAAEIAYSKLNLNNSITNSDLAGNISDSKLSTISTTGKISNSATTATSSNTGLAIVSRDSNGDFVAGTITASLSGNASTSDKLKTAVNIQGVSFDGSSNIIVVTAGTGVSVSGTQVSIGQAVSTTSNVTFNNLTVNGNLDVTGTTYTNSSTNTSYADSLIELHYSNGGVLTSDDGKDIGIRMHYYKSSDKNAALLLANDTQAMEFYVDGTESNGVFSGTYGVFKGSQFESTATTGTAPFVVASTTRVSNLNAATAGNADTVTNGVYTTDTGTVTSTMILNGTIVNADINASANIAVSKLAASTISGVTLGNNLNTLTIGTGLSGTSYNGTSDITIALADGYGDTKNPYADKTQKYFLAAPNAANGAPTFRAIVASDIPTLNQNTTGSAATLTTARSINGVSFNGSADITVTAAAGTLTGTTLNSTVTNSSLTSVGTLTGLTISGSLTVNGAATFNSYSLSINDKNIDLGAVTAVSPTGNITAGSAVVSNLSSTANIIPGSAVTALSGNSTVTLPASTTVSSIDSATQITLSQNLTGTGSATGATLTITGATDTTANGGGITLKGSSDKTFNWVSSTNAWTSSEHLNLANTKAYYINGTSVLNATTLGSNVVNSSLTSVGTLVNLTVTNTITGSVSGNAGTVTNGFYTNSSFYLGTTSVAVNRSSATQTLSGITSIDGGSSASQALTIQSTTGNGTSDSIVFKVGNNGATTAMTINTSGNVIHGSGEGTATVSGNTIRGPNASGTNIAGANLTIASGNGTGTGGSGVIIFQTASTGSTGSTANTMSERMRIDASGNLIPGANNTYNLGSATYKWATMYGVASSANYADLAERYTADDNYEPGTVLEFGGINEVTISNTDMSRKIAGVVSTNPGYLMNAELESEFVVSLALTGRVPCKVQGSIRKGDMLVSASNGYARAEDDPKLGSVIGKALEDFNGITGIIEVVVGRL